MKKFITAFSLCILALAISISGCTKGEDDTVLAKVNRGAITAADFKKQISDLNPQMQQAVLADPKARMDFLEDLIGIELVVQEAKRQGLDRDAEYKKRQDQLKSDLELRVKKAGENDLFNSLLKQELGDKMSKLVPPTDQEVRLYYDKNKEMIKKLTGKQLAYKDIKDQLKMRMMQEKRRELYLAYSKELKDKASIKVDDKAMEAVVTDFAKPADLSGMTVTKVPAAGAEDAKE
jgi:peptidyl-prolyl cis-trans isomerase C